MRTVDGIKVAFVEHDVYFKSLYTPSMYSTARDEEADVCMLLAPGKTEADITDEEVRALLEIMKDTQ